MAKDEMHTVMDTVIGDCRRAYESRTPLIMIDTVEYELVEEIALSGALVAPARRVGEPYLDMELAYYEFIGSRPDRLSGCENLFFGTERLGDTEKLNGAVDSPGLPGIHIISLENGEQRQKGAPQRVLDSLRLYVRSYLSCRDNSAPLRCSCVLLYGDTSLLPEDLQPYTEIVEVGFPSKRELLALVEQMAAESGGRTPDMDTMQEIVSSLAGLGLYEARRLVFRLLSVRTGRGERLIDNRELRRLAIRDVKKQSLLRNGGLLTLCRVKKERLAGMDRYKEWVDEYRRSMQDPEDYLLRRGTMPAKGVLLCGVPGCGKSEAAKILYHQCDEQLPLLQLSVDQLMGGYVGDSERNMRTALRQAEAMAPCILWIDELDKGFSAAASGAGGDRGGTFKRMFGRLLTWMQENERGCFIFATANDISELPPEFFRSGRFENLFAVFMPTSAECRAIFSEQMRRAEERRQDEVRSRYGDSFELTPLFANRDTVENEEDDCFSDEHCLRRIMDIFAANRKFLTGADITKIVNSALLRLDENAPLPITAGQWIEEIRRSADSPAFSSYGCGERNLNSIAACCLRLLGNSFVPVSASPMFSRECLRTCYNSETGKLRVEYALPEGEEPPEDPYDRALYNAIVERFERIADKMENSALERLCRG